MALRKDTRKAQPYTELRFSREVFEPLEEEKGLEAFAFHALAEKLAIAAHGFGALTLALLGWLFEMATQFHFTEDAFALQLLFECAQGLIDVVIADVYLHGSSNLLIS